MEVLDQAVGFLLENKLLLSAFVILVIVLIRKFIISMIRGDVNFLSEDQRKWISRTKNGTFSVIIITLFLLWQSEISEFALSLTAIAVAVVVASKEIILCFTGSIQRASSRSFRIGDWIEVGNLCGEVIEHNLMATVIQEIDLHHGNYNYTGKTATLPNSMFFSIPVKNLNFMKRYVYHSFNIVVGEFRNLYPMFPSLLAKIDDHCEDFIDVAKRYNVVIERHAGVDLPGAEPHISISSANTGEQVVHFMLFCPTDRAFEIEQLVREDFMAMYQRHFGQKA
ncbi:putative Small-conductance mechanosensitive channel [Vibrio nigripulchritudo SFn27]|uniref:Putative Small-conductance mechanosensitive channel n=1 Tax=Vibrio nigripulchritudo TaxID=28173 RepID=U4K458_9VIBR|nr:mechanosensitive ion channel family protein [Vibrio nigripulchritudo]CCN80698.1 putative Small-conductance mechanosensitive channel [Vibrio nigripulchritudo BLFn1]CCN89583.1 putative Small-conductance mechanosensitive channel [Vibrio nigripulchritudo SFn27]CCN96080.1 putative Small-conductance mechanosensitive channel [Vibrio nigripulchritudo ENn2]CCO41701.1 putative Small-conductance mechanosensitive channel [Vibrio nigripulchritudo SFn135]CCO50976.1 putative Small-conductance mechanosensi